MNTPFAPGDILCAVSGYSSTFADFYHVDKCTAHTVTLTPIDRKMTPTDSLYDTAFIPCTQESIGESFRRKIHGEHVRINEHANAYLWDGKPVHTESYS